jgi:hypothetical protein
MCSFSTLSATPSSLLMSSTPGRGDAERVARASRALVSASRGNGLHILIATRGANKSSFARDLQVRAGLALHARRTRYPQAFNASTIEQRQTARTVRACVIPSYFFLLLQTATVTRRKVAGIDVTPVVPLFCRLKSSSSSFCRSAARPFFSAASKAFMVGP